MVNIVIEVSKYLLILLTAPAAAPAAAPVSGHLGRAHLSADPADRGLYLLEFQLFPVSGSLAAGKSLCPAECGHVSAAFCGVCGAVLKIRG